MSSLGASYPSPPPRTRAEANRENAQFSTGPRSAAGKAIASQNATTHGLRATRVLIRGDDPAEFATLRDALLLEYDPINPPKNSSSIASPASNGAAPAATASMPPSSTKPSRLPPTSPPLRPLAPTPSIPPPSPTPNSPPPSPLPPKNCCCLPATPCPSSANSNA